MSQALIRQHLGLLQPYLDMPVKEIVINRPCEVGVELLDGTWQWLEDKNLNLTALNGLCVFMAGFTGQLFDAENPIISFKLPGGHRVEVVTGAYTTEEFSMTIRLNRGISYDIDSYNFTDEEKRQIIDAVTSHKTLLVSGGTASGKTAFLNTLIGYMDAKERLITIEDVSELVVPHRNKVQLLYSSNKTAVGNKSVKDLLNSVLRMRPDRILFGELRQENAITFCTSINTGHEGAIATIHANSPEDAIESLVNRIVINGDAVSGSIEILRKQLLKDIYGVIQLKRVGRGIKGYFRTLKPEQTLSTHPFREAA